MTVHILLEAYYDDIEILAVYTKLELAEAAMELTNMNNKLFKPKHTAHIQSFEVIA